MPRGFTAGHHGDTRIRRKSTRRAFRSWSLGAFLIPIRPVSLRYELPGFCDRDLHGFGLRLYQVRQPRVSVARSGQRPVLTGDDPLDVFGDQRQQTLSVAAADPGEEVLHDLDVLLDAHGNFSISTRSDRSRSDRERPLPAGREVVFISRT
jgi:hypothetical protein